jgi:hypothetical protein
VWMDGWIIHGCDVHEAMESHLSGEGGQIEITSEMKRGEQRTRCAYESK